ncbi:hypothetical protein VITU102760_19775 [Vibrio tubiashii]|uniref:Uncharacterized protein n=1 Tax=Vibrio tubiashii ATCC 19109 TaxID=1051646 RepID=F9T1N5_9VIBR|nr:hypothetical protein [Vibrio tubiashii]AIW17255.1 hypothetical protein IX91_24575 [Vibrio tubiashii ATCC 19109]EGU58152.1 hypothetical protein VITU9109_19457 [Vibrio tubiashii ATCC 19109]EIF04981.1 hypothetical protein VT1337_05724 [Vibrio tubiashii NCIMB 1337 = ATCC 19106]
MENQKLVESIKAFKEAYGDYFKLFLDTYPLLLKNKENFGCNELFLKAIECQALASTFGVVAKDRFNTIGFNQLVPFDNPVDWYNWKEFVVKNEISHTIYASLAIRLDSEIQRMLYLAENDLWKHYELLDSKQFLVSYLKYDCFQDKNIQVEDSESHDISADSSNSDEGRAFDNLDRMQKQTSIWSNVINVISKVVSL